MKHLFPFSFNCCRFTHKLLLFVFIIITLYNPLKAQYLMDWQVSQHYYEMGLPYFDITGDGTPELTKYLGNTVTIFDGTQNWAIVWSITASGYDELILWDLFSTESGQKALCLATTLFDQVSTSVQVYDIYGETPKWSTSSFEGYYSNVVITDLNGSEGSEILLGCNQWNESTARYSCRFYILNGETGSIDYESSSFNGYLKGPYAADLDGNGIQEILINVYTADSTSTLSVFSYHGSSSVKEVMPEEFSMDTAFPNPFNGTVTVPFTVPKPSELTFAIYDISGRMVYTTPSCHFSAGSHQYTLDFAKQSSGVYFIRLWSGKTFQEQKIVHIK